MANKENKLEYMQSPLPKGRKYGRNVKVSWSGLNKREVLDTGALSEESNISTKDTPYLTPSPIHLDAFGGYNEDGNRYMTVSRVRVEMSGAIYLKSISIDSDNIELPNIDLEADLYAEGTTFTKESDALTEIGINIISGSLTVENVSGNLAFHSADRCVFDCICNYDFDNVNDVYISHNKIWDTSQEYKFLIRIIDKTGIRNRYTIHKCEKYGNSAYSYKGVFNYKNQNVFYDGNKNGEALVLRDIVYRVSKEATGIKLYNNAAQTQKYDVPKVNNSTPIDMRIANNTGDRSYFAVIYACYVANTAQVGGHDKASIRCDFIRIDDTPTFFDVCDTGIIEDYSLSAVTTFDDVVKKHAMGITAFNKQFENSATITASYTRQALLVFPDRKRSWTTFANDYSEQSEYRGKYKGLIKRGNNGESGVQNGEWKKYYEYGTSSFDVDISSNTYLGCFNFQLIAKDLSSDTSNAPELKYVTANLGRVFGVYDDNVVAGYFNNFDEWSIDTSDEIEPKNAWLSLSQANPNASNKFTEITNYSGRVVCFKSNFMQEIYGTKNPFKLIDVYADGCINSGASAEVGGKLVFVSDDGVKIYTGSVPKLLSYNLKLSDIKYAKAGADSRYCYVFVETRDYDGLHKYLYVYDTYCEQWSERAIEQDMDYRILSFANSDAFGMYMLDSDGCVKWLDSNTYTATTGQAWYCVTDFVTKQPLASSGVPTADIKHIKKIQMLADIPRGSKIIIKAIYNDSGDETTLYDSGIAYGDRYKLPIRFKLRKSANYGFKIRIEGTGYAKIYEMELFMERGGDLYKDGVGVIE